MGKREAFHNDDDVSRLRILPSGVREYCGSDGNWSACIERDLAFSNLHDSTLKLKEAGAADSASEVMKQLKQIGRTRSMLDAAEATLLAEGLELVHRSEGETGTQDPLFDNELQEQAATHYRVDPRNTELIRSSFVTEASSALRQSERNLRNKLTIAEGLRHLCPSTLAELSNGNITTKSAIEIVRNSQDLEPESCRQLEHVLLPIARTSPDSAVLKRAKAMRARMLPETPEERRTRKITDRSVKWWAEDDGMAMLQAFLPAEDILAIFNTIAWHASQHQDPDDERTEQQIRADIFRDALLDGWPETKGAQIKARIALTIPALEMLTNPNRTMADLEGYGPIPLGAALKMAKYAPSFIKILTDPWSGAAIDIGRTRYRPPSALRDFLRWRDEHCRFPGCNRLPDTTEVDHIEDWAKGGRTSRTNTQLLCKRHQMYKHALGWQSTYLPDGSVQWRSPHGVVQIALPGSIQSAESFDPDPVRNPMLPTINVDDQVRRLLGWHDPPDQEAG